MRQPTKDQYFFLVLVISGKKCTLYKHESGKYSKIAHGPESVAEVVNDVFERVSNFADPKMRKQTTLVKFLRSIDHWLGKINDHSTLPIFLLAPKMVIGYFNKITAHKKNIVGHIHGNFDDLTIPELHKLTQQFCDQLDRLNNLETAH